MPKENMEVPENVEQAEFPDEKKDAVMVEENSGSD